MRNFDEYMLDDGSKLTEQEKWVLESVEIGAIANLAKWGIQTGKRQLRANFIEKLVMNEFKGFQVHRKGIRIINAIIPESLDLEFADVRHFVALKATKFKGEVILRDATFDQILLFDESQFLSKVNYERLKVIKNASYRKVVFWEGANFNGVEVKGNLNLSGVHFLNEGTEINFNGIKVSHTAILNHSIFCGDVTFLGAEIGLQFSMELALLEKKADFNSMNGGQSASFRGSVFNGGVDFGGANCTGQFQAEKTWFNNEVIKANFNNLKVRQNVFLDGAVFKGAVDFIGADIGGQFIAQGVHFINADKKINFSSMKVEDDALFRYAIFEGIANFNSANINGNLILEMTDFNNEDENTNCDFIRVQKVAIFNGIVFNKGVSIFAGKLSNLIIQAEDQPNKSKFNDYDLLFIKKVNNLNLFHTTIENQLDIANIDLGKIRAENLKVKGSAKFRNVNFIESINFKNSNFNNLNFINIKYTKKKDNISIEGMTYKSINAAGKIYDWRKLLELLSYSQYNAQPYSQLEHYFKQIGFKERANKVFVSGKRREWLRSWKTLNPLKWASNIIKLIFLNLGVRYGRSPLRAV